MTPNQPPRLVVRQTYYHTRPGRDPDCCEPRYVRWLATADQPCIRELSLTDSWVPLDTGWVKEPSLVVVANDELPEKFPADEAEKTRVAAATVVIGRGGEALLEVRPGEAQPLCLARAALAPHIALSVRAVGTARVTITAFPS